METWKLKNYISLSQGTNRGRVIETNFPVQKMNTGLPDTSNRLSFIYWFPKTEKKSKK